MPCLAEVWRSVWADWLLITSRLVSSGFWKEHLSSYHNYWFIAFGISVELNQCNRSITLLTDGLRHVYLTVFNAFLRISQCKVPWRDLTMRNTPERDWGVISNKHMAIYSTLSIEQTFALASPSNNQSWKTNTLFSMTFRHVCTDLGLCWSNMNE